MTIAFDPAFGDAGQIAPGEASWLIDSPANRALDARLREAGGRDRNSAVFSPSRQADPTEQALEIWFEVLDHHPSVTEALIVGYTPTPGFEEAVRPMTTSRTADGAVIRRA